MDNDPKQAETGILKAVKRRPVILTVFCLFSFVFFGLLALLFLAGLFNATWITTVANQYLPTEVSTKAETMLVFGAGFSLHGLAFAGVLLIWNLRRTGYYLLGLSCLMMAGYQLLNPLNAISSTAVYVILIFLFGLFFKRLH